MEIVKLQAGESIELKIAGRLDAYWAEHLGSELKATIREGNHHLILDLSGVDYISSAGIRVLLTYYGQLNEINGSLSVSRLSGPAKSILETAGLSGLLQPASAPPAVAETQSKKLKSARASFEVFTLQSAAELHCTLLGQPELLEECAFQPENAKKLRMDKSSFAFANSLRSQERQHICRPMERMFLIILFPPAIIFQSWLSCMARCAAATFLIS